MAATLLAELPAEIRDARAFVPSLSAFAVDALLRRHERQAARARLLAADYLLDLAERRLFRELGYSSVMHYGTHALGLTPRGVWERLRMARALRELPRITAALRAGRLSWSKGRELVRVATATTEEDWLGQALRLSCRELEAAIAAAAPPPDPAGHMSRYTCQFVAANTVRVTVDLTPEQFALLDQAIGAIRQRLGTEDPADALELITRAYLARVGEEAPALRQQVVVHRCRDCRNEWRETSKGRVPARAAANTITDVVEVDDPSDEAPAARHHRDDGEGTSHVGSLRSRYVPRDVLRNVRRRDEGRCQVPGCLNGHWSQLHHIRFFSRGGSQRTRNLLTLCTQHHRQVHDGHLVLRGGDAEQHRFTDARGRRL